jgi:hypothetical protein
MAYGSNTVKLEIEINAEACEVIATKTSRQTKPWSAFGMWGERQIEGRGASAQSAINDWKRKALLVADYP